MPSLAPPVAGSLSGRDLQSPPLQVPKSITTTLGHTALRTHQRHKRLVYRRITTYFNGNWRTVHCGKSSLFFHTSLPVHALYLQPQEDSLVHMIRAVVFSSSIACSAIIR